MVGSCIMKLNFSASFEAIIIHKTGLLMLHCRQPFSSQSYSSFDFFPFFNQIINLRLN